MNTKEPVLLVTLVDTKRMRWLAGGIGLDQTIYPLLVSEDNDIAGYRQMEADEQTLFLRHRFCGVLQTGCDRLWGLQKKACQFVFVTDDIFPDAPRQLTDRVSDHLVKWLANPPVVFTSLQGESFEVRPVELDTLAGEMAAEFSEVLTQGLPLLLDEIGQSDRWELVPSKRRKQ